MTRSGAWRGVGHVLAALVVTGAATLASAVGPSPARAATVCSWAAGDGEWTDPTNWTGCGGGYPAVGASPPDVVIDTDSPGVTVTVTGAGAGAGALQIGSVDRVVVADGGTLAVSGPTVDNFGEIRLESAGAPTRLEVAGTVDLGGGGTVAMTHWRANAITGSGVAPRLRNVDNRIEGSGEVGLDLLALENLAGATVAGTGWPGIELDPAGATVNAGLIEADGGAVRVWDTAIDNTGGTLRSTSTPGSMLVFREGVHVSGGAVGVAGETRLAGGTVDAAVHVVPGGRLRAKPATVSRLGGTLHNEGLTAIENGAALHLDDGLVVTNDAIVRMRANSSVTRLVADGRVEFRSGTATGVIQLSNSPRNRIEPGTGGGTIVSIDNTLRGAGEIIAGLDNRGTVRPDRNYPLVLAPATGDVVSSGLVDVPAGRRLFVTGPGRLVQTAGRLNIDGLVKVDASVDVEGGELGGGGRIVGSVVDGGTTSAGTVGTIGMLEVIGQYTQTETGVFVLEVNGPGRSEYDRLKVRGTLVIQGSLDVRLNYEAADTDLFQFVINDEADAVSGAYIGWPNGKIRYINGRPFATEYDGGSGNDVILVGATFST